MDEPRSEVQAIYEVLAKETLRAARMVGELRDSIPLIMEQFKRNLQELHEEQLRNLRKASQDLDDRSKHFEAMKLELHRDAAESIAAHKQLLSVSSGHASEEWKAELIRTTVCVAEGAACRALESSLSPISVEAARSTLRVVEELKKVAHSLESNLSNWGWKFLIKLAMVVLFSMALVNVGNRVIDNVWPWKLTSDDQYYLDQGKLLWEIWPEIEPQTQKKLEGLIQSHKTESK